LYTKIHFVTKNNIKVLIFNKNDKKTFYLKTKTLFFTNVSIKNSTFAGNLKFRMAR